MEADGVTLGEADRRSLAERLGQLAFRQRAERQAQWMARHSVQARSPVFPWWRLVSRTIHATLHASGLARAGARNFAAVRLMENDLPVRGLPTAFEGCRVLHLADLHLDLAPDVLREPLLRVIRQARYDVVVGTGDYCHGDAARRGVVWQLVQDVFAAAGTPAWTTLGNHDFLELVPRLEANGVRVLLNEAEPWERGGQTLWLAGVDDPHYYQTADLKRALREVPPGASALLLAHTPDYAPIAAAEPQVGAMLCGHTHGGQICLPGGRPLLTHCDCSRALVRGPWIWNGLPGYTSPGAGGSSLPVRFNCPPEVTVHVLHGAP